MNPELSRFTAYLPPGATILDLGAGTGETAAELILQGYTLFAIDNNPQALQALTQLPKITVINATLPLIPLKQLVDALWCANTLPWLSQTDQQATITQASTLLKPKGICYYSTRSPDPRGKESMLIPLTPELIKQSLLDAGLILLTHYPDQQDPRWHHWFARKK
ncbi:class I SAM-dependent methyltransferase [Candidatus Pacearchaeota archaeon]|nr:class I SAM-dependent methyltransferase [Candidatus Pacearchaeota archaeon]